MSEAHLGVDAVFDKVKECYYWPPTECMKTLNIMLIHVILVKEEKLKYEKKC